MWEALCAIGTVILRVPCPSIVRNVRLRAALIAGSIAMEVLPPEGDFQTRAQRRRLRQRLRQLLRQGDLAVTSAAYTFDPKTEPFSELGNEDAMHVSHVGLALRGYLPFQPL